MKVVKKNREVAYAMTKVKAERYVYGEAEKHGFAAFGVRPCHVIGPLLSASHQRPWCWQTRIGVKRALDMILTGHHVSADEGKALGFVNEVVPHDELMDVARNWAETICQCAPLSIRASKDVVYRSLDCASLEESMKTQYDSVVAMRNSEDFIEGPKAFSEKRPPNWQGK